MDPRFGLLTFGPLLALAFAQPLVAARTHAPRVAGPERALAFGLFVALLVFTSANQYARLQWNTGFRMLAPALPLDGQYPFLHLDRKFMHLGFHIYDIGFQSPNVEAAKPMVFVTTLLLVLIVLLMSSTAIILRERMKRKYTIKSF